MSFLSKITEKAFRAAGATELREYAAAGHSRLVGDWTTDNNSANQEIRSSIRQLRARGRQLARDNDYVVGFLKKLVANVLGPEGMKHQVNATKADSTQREALNSKVEDAFKLWSRKKNCDVTGQSSLRDIAELSLRTLATEGEFMFRYVNEAGELKLQMLDVDWLDEDFNDPNYKNTGNRIIMSVEVNQYDRPVAYHFTNPRWNNVAIPGSTPLIPASQQRLRIPANEIVHRFLKHRVGQMRGITSLHASMLTLNQVDGFDTAELVGMRVAASNMAFVSPPTDDSGSQLGKKTTPIENEVAPGQILELPAGYTVHEFAPKQPTDSSFAKRMLRKVASGLGVNYNTLTSDLEGVNFSSIRAGTVEERELWRLMQKWFAEHFYQDIFETWLMFYSQLVPVTLLDQVMYPTWRGRGFEWVDPLKDVNADIMAINRGLKTMTEVIEERGGDFKELMQQHADEKKLIESLDLQFASPDLQAQLAADAAANDANNNDSGSGSSSAKSGK